MLFEKRPSLPLQQYTKQSGKFVVINDRVKTEQFLGFTDRDELFYWGHNLHRSTIEYRKARKFLTYFQIIISSASGLGLLLLFLALIQKIPSATWLGFDFWLGESMLPSIFWLAVMSFLFSLYRILSLKKDVALVYQNKDLKNKEVAPADILGADFNKKHSHDISDAFTSDVMDVLDDAYHIADQHGDEQVLAEHVFFALLQKTQIQSMFIRLQINPKEISNKFAEQFTKQKNNNVPIVSQDAIQAIFFAYKNAQDIKQSYVNVTELLEEVIRSSEKIQELLYDAGIDEKKLVHVIGWIRLKEQMRRRYIEFRKSAALRSKHGIDRAMTAVSTPFLDSFSKDITNLAKLGYLEPCVAREKEIEEIYRILESGSGGVLLVGEGGVGKNAIIQGIAQRILEDDVPGVLHDKRLIELSTSSLLAGTTVSGAQERLIGITNEIAHSGNIVLFINNIHDLFGAGSDQGAGGLDVSESLAEYVKNGQFVTLATTNHEGYQKFIANSELGSSIGKIDITELDVDKTIEVVESKTGSVEYKHSVFFSYEAIEKASELSSRFLRDQYLPESAISLINEAASYAKQKHGANTMVTAEDVAVVVSEKTGVPTTTISQDEGGKLMQLEEEMHKNVIGQDEAVTQVANALRRARADISSSSRPIANFLFLGPTGVGKTELAKTIANVYFGGEDKMIRLDMSEYQDRGAIYRLIGQTGEKGSGVLTEAIRQNPFSLILLDEMEKADKDVLNLFLQVFDDGRLTDSVGRVVDFSNAIIIATSNAATRFVQDEIAKGTEVGKIKEALLHTELAEYYRPEFLNRFDGIILFQSLTREHIIKVSSLMLNKIKKDLKTRGIFMEVDQSALEHLADIGYDPEFGARPMRRAIQDFVENKLAELLLAGKVQRRDTIVLTGSDIIVRPAK